MNFDTTCEQAPDEKEKKLVERELNRRMSEAIGAG